MKLRRDFGNPNISLRPGDTLHVKHEKLINGVVYDSREVAVDRIERPINVTSLKSYDVENELGVTDGIALVLGTAEGTPPAPKPDPSSTPVTFVPRWMPWTR